MRKHVLVLTRVCCTAALALVCWFAVVALVFQPSLTAGSYALMLLALGLILAFVVFQWLRGNRHERYAEQMQQDDAQQQNRRLHELIQSLQCAHEQRLLGVAQQLHDDVGQRLNGLSLEVSWLSGRLKNGQQPVDLANLRSQIIETIHVVRRLSADLRPLTLNVQDLVAAIDALCKSFGERYGIMVTLDLPAATQVTDEQTRFHLFRLIDAALTHFAQAKALKTHVRLTVVNQRLMLEVTGVGGGMKAQPEQSEQDILLMREHAWAAGGELAYSTLADGNALLTVNLPVPSVAGEPR